MRRKHKTLAAWLAFLAGPVGAHRFYLHGWSDTLGWALPIPTALGLWGLDRAFTFGQDDQLAWALIPLLGFTVAACSLTAIVYGLTSAEKWHARFNAGFSAAPAALRSSDELAPPPAAADATNWLTIGVVVAALLVGTTVLMSSIVFSFQRYFEYQIEEGRKISQ